jgi:hypothetical protein
VNWSAIEVQGLGDPDSISRRVVIASILVAIVGLPFVIQAIIKPLAGSLIGFLLFVFFFALAAVSVCPEGLSVVTMVTLAFAGMLSNVFR